MTHHKPVRNITNVLLAASVAVLLFGGGYSYGKYQSAQEQKKLFSQRNIDFTLFWNVWDTVSKKYVDQSKIDQKKMYLGAIKGMVASIDDPYTFFLNTEENKQSKDDLGGKFEGIGAQLGLKDNLVVVVAPLKNSPAEKAGIKAGDIIYKVDNTETKDMPLTRVVSLVRGDRGTKVTLSIVRAGKQLEFVVVRDVIQVDSVELTYEKNIAHLKLNQFGDKTVDEWENKVADIKLKWERGEIKGLVLDLRDNPGGYLESSVYLAGEFLPAGKIVVKQESVVYETKTYTVNRQGKLLDIPMVVLVNKGSASASEILSGALRDNKRAMLIGEKTFGKGSVQEAIDLGDGAGLHVTVAKWVLPGGEWINGKGIEPQIKIENTAKEGNTLTREDDVQLDRAIEEVVQ
jgi:carboxyl-terminal processing protease